MYPLLDEEMPLAGGPMLSLHQHLATRVQVEIRLPNGGPVRTRVVMALQLIGSRLDSRIQCVADQRIPGLENSLLPMELAYQNWVSSFKGIPQYRQDPKVQPEAQLLHLENTFQYI